MLNLDEKIEMEYDMGPDAILGNVGPYHEHSCPVCEYVMSFASNDWYVCGGKAVVCRHGSNQHEHITVPIEEIDEYTGMMSPAKTVYRYWLHLKETGAMPEFRKDH